MRKTAEYLIIRTAVMTISLGPVAAQVKHLLELCDERPRGTIVEHAVTAGMIRRHTANEQVIHAAEVRLVVVSGNAVAQMAIHRHGVEVVLQKEVVLRHGEGQS